MAPMKKQKKDDKKKKAKTFLELKKSRGKEKLQRLRARDVEAQQREELKQLKEKKLEDETKALLQTQTAKEKESEIIKNFRKELPNLSLDEFAKQVKKEYNIDIGKKELLTNAELADARRKLIASEAIKKRARPRRTREEIQAEMEAKQAQEQEKIARALAQAAAENERQQRARRITAKAEREKFISGLSSKIQSSIKKQAEEKQQLQRQIQAVEPQSRATQNVVAAKRMQEQEIKRRGKLIEELGKELDRYTKTQEKLDASIKTTSNRLRRLGRDFTKKFKDQDPAELPARELEDYRKSRADIEKNDADLRILEDKKERLARVLDVLKANKRVVNSSAPLDRLEQLEEEDAQLLGLSRVGEREVGIQEANRRERAKYEMPAGAAAAAAAAAPEGEAAAAAEEANLVADMAQPPENVIQLQPDENANNADALANVPEPALAAVNEGELGQGLIRHFAIHPSHIKETKNSYTLTGKGMKHAKMLYKYLPNHASKLVAFSLLNKARNKLHKLDKKARGGGIGQDIMTSLVEGLFR
jgi:hypothetical protein